MRSQFQILDRSSLGLQENHLSEVHCVGCTCRARTQSRRPPGPQLHSIQVLHPRCQQIITDMKKLCPGCIKLNKKSFTDFEANIPDVLKSVQPPFSFFQADICGPILASQDDRIKSITIGFRRTFALRGTPRIIWIDAGLNIVKAGKDLINTEMKIISALNLKFSAIEFRVTLPKHHAGIGAVERIIGSIKNTGRKSISGPHPLKMNDEELLTWIHLVIDKLNNRPLILAALLGITLTPNHILLGF